MFIGRVARITHSLNKRKQRKAIDKLINLTITRQRRLEQQKPALFVTLKNTVIHYYHGFRLFGLEVKVASRLFIKTLRGHSLTRQEQRQFRRTVGDVIRIVPFSVFIIIPFMEFLLPVYLWLFPNALPSTFQSKSSKEARKKKDIQKKLKMAKFVEEMSNLKKAKAVQRLANFFKKVM
jgi:LETM1 and EF-hand domain-containing protein 1